jgi:hypothetical protein
MADDTNSFVVEGFAMRKSYLPPYSFGAIEGFFDVFQDDAKFQLQRTINLPAILYASAFQAGIDQFCVPEDFTDDLIAQSSFLASRAKGIPITRFAPYTLVQDAFSAHLPDDWLLGDDFAFARFLCRFVADLMIASSERTSILHLSSWGSIPNMITKVNGRLPSEIFVPISNLFSMISCSETPNPISQHVLSADDIERLNDILKSDLFDRYSASHASLDDAEIPITTAVSRVVATGRKLFSEKRGFLTLKKCGANVLQITPKVVDAIFGKLTGTVAELVTKIAINILESDRRIVIYDLQKTAAEIVAVNLANRSRGTPRPNK